MWASDDWLTSAYSIQLPHIFLEMYLIHRETTFLISCLLSCITNPFWKEVLYKRKKISPKGANSFLLEQTIWTVTKVYPSLTHCRLNELPHTICWKILIAFLGMSLAMWFITKTRLFKYIENFTFQNWKFSDKKFWYFSCILLLKT